MGWTNVARVRAWCLAVFGYDPEIENWDHSPFHHNESGSQNMTTLAVAGRSATVPLVEGHSAIRERWTANLTTFSNEDRLKKEGPPYFEIMFKATAEGPLEKRLREHVRSRGYGPWVSVTTSEKALTDKPTFSHSSSGTCRRSMSTSRGDGGSSWPMISRRTSPQQYLICAGRATMSSFRMAAVSRLLLEPLTLISISM